MKHHHSKRTRRPIMKALAAGGLSLHGVAWSRTNGHCWYCGVEVPREQVTLDHQVPIVHGGLHQLSNIVASCQRCNTAKAQRSLDAYRERCSVTHFWGEQHP